MSDILQVVGLGWCWGRGRQRRDSHSACSPVQEPDTDLEVVLEKKGNVDEAHIDQVRPASPLSGHKVLISEAPTAPKAVRPAPVVPLHTGSSAFAMSWWETLSASLAAGQLVTWNLMMRLSSLLPLPTAGGEPKTRAGNRASILEKHPLVFTYMRSQ